MRLRNTGTRSLTWIGLLLCAGGVFVAVPAASGADPTPPPNPSQGQISAAQSQKDQLASEVGRLGGQIAAARAQLAALQGQAEMAEQKVAYAVSKERDAEAAVQAADQAVRTADAKVEAAARTVAAAHTKFVQYLQSSYENGQPDSGVGALLTAKDPSGLLQQTTLEQYAAQNKLDAVGQMQTATVHKSNLDAKARQARERAKEARAKAKAAAADAEHQKQLADDAVAAQQVQAANLQQTLTSSQTELNSAQSRLATLNHQHAQYVAYQAEQARLRREREERARRLAAERAAAAQAAARRAARERAQRHESGGSGNGGGGHSSGGGNGGGGGGPVDYDPVSPSGGSWTAARGREAVARAMDELGTPYAWAGGGASGPSYGVCDASNGAPNDCNVVGFDCSGLAMYAWGPFESMPHYAKLQYSVAGDKHPSLSNLKPGDLLFYSYNGSVSGIHHVAIYKGNGQIVQAPYSGAYVEVSSMYDPGPIFGATRPLT